MHLPIKGARRDWPYLLLDEVWLRVRKALVHRLQVSDLWSQAAMHDDLVNERKALGRYLERQFLRQLFTRTNYAFLNSDTIFGVRNYHFRTRLPLELTFGYELGAGLYDLLENEPARVTEAAELCSVLTFGAAVLDLAYDDHPNLLEEFFEAPNGSVVRRYLPGALEAGREPSLIFTGTAVRELQILFTIISWLCSKAGRLWNTLDEDEVLEKVSSLLFSAYRENVRCGSAEEEVCVHSPRASRAKKALPFNEIHQAARLCANPSSEEDREVAVASLVVDLSTAFRLIGELVSIPSDFRTGSTNLLLVRARNGTRQSRRASHDYSTLVNLLEREYIEDAADEVRGSVASVISALQSGALRSDVADRFRDALLFFVKNRVERRI